MADSASAVVFLLGLELSNYRIIEEIGSGGIGVYSRRRQGRRRGTSTGAAGKGFEV